MKNILYIVAIVAILAGAWFSYDSKSKFETLKSQREQLDAKNENRKANIKTSRKEEKERRLKVKKAKSDLSDAQAGVDNAKSKLNLTKAEAAQWKGKIASIQRKLDANAETVKAVKEAFSSVGTDITLDEIPSMVQKLEDDLKETNKKLEETQALADAANSRVVADDTQIRDLTDRNVKRARNIAGNGLKGCITAVNHDWGFVTIEMPSGLNVKTTSKLMIQRGMSYIGDLKVNSIEGRRVVADIDYRSMKSGMVVQPGDSVILAVPETN